MSDSTTHPGPDPRMHPGQILINLLVSLLAPMFLEAAGGDVTYARIAATETIHGYRCARFTDLIFVAQAVAFGLAALGSLGLSMGEGLSPLMVLRLRANANSCSRSADRCRRASPEDAIQAPEQPEPARQPRQAQPQKPQSRQPEPSQPEPSQPEPSQPEPSQPEPSQPEPSQAEPSQPAPAPMTPAQEQEWRDIWSASAARVAEEAASGHQDMDEEQRRNAEIWADVLKAAAETFAHGNLPARPRPGDRNFSF